MSVERPCVYWNDGYCKKFSDDELMSWCVDGPCKDETPSNADRIRAMSDELLASQMVVVVEETIKVLTNLDVPDEVLNEVRSQMLERLKQPAEVE